MRHQQQKSPNYSNKFSKFQAYYDQYSQEIKQEYFEREETKKLNNPFIALHSDYLNIQKRQDQNVYTKSTFHDGDIIMQIRGMVVTQNALKQNLVKIGKTSAQYDGCYGVLLWLNIANRIIIKPKGLSESIIKSSQKFYKDKIQSKNKSQGNCYIQPHFGSKLFIKSSDIIPRDQQIILDEQSLSKFIYK